MNICPHCGVSLHEDASFCPACAKSINKRVEPKPPRPMLKKVLLLGISLLVIAGFALGTWMYRKPVIAEGNGEVTYTDADGTYQLLLSYVDTRYLPVYEMQQTVELEGDYTMPSSLFINHKDTGADAGQIFLQKVDRVTTGFIQPADSASPMGCTAPAARDFVPGSALVSSITFTGRSDAAELLWTIHMKNGDTILIHQKYILSVIETFDYGPADAPMDTIEELQALVNEIEETVDKMDVVNLHLPAVTYEGGLVIEARHFNLYGSTEGEQRTTFTDTVRVTPKKTHICYFHDIDFVGGGDGVGVSSSSRLHLINCYITGWKTGMLGYGYAWVNLTDSRVENNDIGFHFNSPEDGGVSHTLYPGNRFTGNGTAVLLEKVPTDATLDFGGSIFSGNGKDIDNLCDQPIDISEVIFK